MKKLMPIALMALFGFCVGLVHSVWTRKTPVAVTSQEVFADGQFALTR